MHKIYEHGKFIVLEGHNQYIVLNKDKKFEQGHTHISKYNTARWLIRLSEGLIVPKHISSYLVESLIRINTDKGYVKKLRKLKQQKLKEKGRNMKASEETVCMAPEQALFKDLLNEDKKLDESKVLKFLKDYVEMCSNVSEVYKSLTNGMLTKCNYPPDVVLKMVQSIQEDTIPRNETLEDLLQIVGTENEILRQNVIEYFSK